MIARILVTLGILLSILILPFWLFAFFLTLAVILLPFYWEGLILILVVETLYGAGMHFPSFPTFLVVFVLGLIAALIPIREIIRK